MSECYITDASTCSQYIKIAGGLKITVVGFKLQIVNDILRAYCFIGPPLASIESMVGYSIHSSDILMENPFLTEEPRYRTVLIM